MENQTEVNVMFLEDGRSIMSMWFPYHPILHVGEEIELESKIDRPDKWNPDAALEAATYKVVAIKQYFTLRYANTSKSIHVIEVEVEKVPDTEGS